MQSVTNRAHDDTPRMKKMVQSPRGAIFRCQISGIFQTSSGATNPSQLRLQLLAPPLSSSSALPLSAFHDDDIFAWAIALRPLDVHPLFALPIPRSRRLSYQSPDDRLAPMVVDFLETREIRQAHSRVKISQDRAVFEEFGSVLFQKIGIVVGQRHGDVSPASVQAPWSFAAD